MKTLKVFSVVLCASALIIGGMSSFTSDKSTKNMRPGWTKKACPAGMSGYICQRISDQTCPVTITPGAHGIEKGIYNCHIK